MIRFSRFLLLFLLSVNLTVCKLDTSQNSLVFTTRHGMGFDKWASIWLIKRHVSPGTSIRWLKQQYTDSNSGVLFDTENALYKRTGKASTFSTLITGFNVKFEFLPDFLQLVHDVEINYWGTPEFIYSNYVENQFRHLQEIFGQKKTPMSCYLEFFDNLETNLPRFQEIDPEKFNEVQLLPNTRCAEKDLEPKTPRNQLVSEWPIETVLKAIEKNKKIVFIDVREIDEFTKHHLPGAINVKIRDITKFDITTLDDADLVVPYCVKDFRGFEMARLLKQQNVKNVLLMRPYGLKGWMSMGLPTAGIRTEESTAIKQLKNCAENLDICLESATKI